MYIVDPEFTDLLLNKWLAYLGKARFATFLSDSVASRLGQHDFDAKLDQWLDEFGRDEEGLNKFASIAHVDGIAARYKIMDVLITYYARNERWTQLMSQRLVQLVPVNQIEEVTEAIILQVVRESAPKRGYKQDRKKRDLGE